MKQKLFGCLILVALLATGQAFAQTAFNTGSVYGKVFGDDGQPLPGVTITVESEGMSPRTAFTGDGGGYRFVGLEPGTYAVTFSLQGFTEVRQEDIKLNAGSNVNLEITLRPATSEQVVVSGEAPLVDTKKTSTSSSYNSEYLKSVPSARDPWVILDQTPGIDVDRINVGGSQSGQQSNFTSKGGSFTSNAWSYDGVDISDPAAQGATPTYYDFDSFEEIQVTTGGQDPAIATGGVVINFITKRGGNSWSGQGSGYFDNDSLQTDNVDSDLQAQHFAKANGIDKIYEYGGDIGGPIMKDKAWIWGAYRKQDITTHTATVLLHNQRNTALNGTPSGNAPQHIVLDDVNLKFNVAYNPENEGSYQYLYGNKSFAGRFALPPNQQAPESTFDQSGPTNMYKAAHTWIPNPSLFLDAKFAFIENKFTFAPMPGVDPNAQPVFRLGHGNTYIEKGIYYTYDTKRPQYTFSEDTNYFKQNWAGGDHEFKFGFAYKTTDITSLTQYGGDVILYDLTGNPHDASAGFGLAKFRYGDIKYNMTNMGAYVGDTWRMDRLTLNLGLRFDHYSTKALASSQEANKIVPDLLPALSFSGADGPTFNDISPRIGATYDVSGTGKTIIRGNYARFYDGMNPGPAAHLDPLSYTGLYMYYYDANADGRIDRSEVLDSYGVYSTFGGMIPGNAAATIANRAASRTIDSNYSGQSTDEFMIGGEHQFGENYSAGASYTHRKYSNLEDYYRPGITSSDFVCEPLTTVNPVTGETFTNDFCDTTHFIDAFHLLNVNNRSRTYDGVEFSFGKRMSNNWMARVTGDIKSQKIHYGDNGQNFGDSFQDPTDIGFTNNTWWAEQSSGSGSGGVFTGSRWGVKFSGAYQFPKDITVGGYFKILDGDVVPIIVRVFQQNYAFAYAYPLQEKFDAERFKTLYYSDLRVEKGFSMGSAGKVSVSADIFNLFNTNYTTRIQRRAETSQFREAQEIVSPRIVRFGFRYNF